MVFFMIYHNLLHVHVCSRGPAAVARSVPPRLPAGTAALAPPLAIAGVASRPTKLQERRGPSPLSKDHSMLGCILRLRTWITMHWGRN